MLPRFYPILDTAVLRSRAFPVLGVAEALLHTGARIVQYRHKDAWTQPDYDEAVRIAAMCREAGIPFVMNDRADYAGLLGCGLHIGQDDLPPVAARKIVGDVLLGYSTHNKRQLSFGDEEPVDYLSLGPIYATLSKQNPDPVVGLDGLRQLRALTSKPVVAIGGITIQNAPAAFDAGADSVAVISGYLPSACSNSELTHLISDWLSIKR